MDKAVDNFVHNFHKAVIHIQPTVYPQAYPQPSELIIKKKIDLTTDNHGPNNNNTIFILINYYYNIRVQLWITS